MNYQAFNNSRSLKGKYKNKNRHSRWIPYWEVKSQSQNLLPTLFFYNLFLVTQNYTPLFMNFFFIQLRTFAHLYICGRRIGRLWGKLWSKTMISQLTPCLRIPISLTSSPAQSLPCRHLLWWTVQSDMVTVGFPLLIILKRNTIK